MSPSSEVSQEVDRVVIGVYRQIGPKHGHRIRTLASEAGLSRLGFIQDLADFLLAGQLTAEVAVARELYTATDDVMAWLRRLEEAELVSRHHQIFRATPSLVPLLDALRDATAAESAALWARHDEDVAIASEAARKMGDAATPSHVVAVAHQSLPEPRRPAHRLHHRLVTLRYMRQHDHAGAWSARKLTPGAIGTMSALWRGEQLGAEPRDLDRLVSQDLATSRPLGLTASGVDMRQAIENETNRATEASLRVLTQDEVDGFVAALQRLPDGDGPPG